MFERMKMRPKVYQGDFAPPTPTGKGRIGSSLFQAIKTKNTLKKRKPQEDIPTPIVLTLLINCSKGSGRRRKCIIPPPLNASFNLFFYSYHNQVHNF